MLRTSPARHLAITLSSVCILALAAPAGAEDTGPATVANGTFASPTVPSGQDWAYLDIEGWDGPGLLSAGRANHPRGYQAAFLATPGSGKPLSTLLRDVPRGATVTLTWDDNPDTCAGSDLPKRAYTVTVAGAADQPGKFTTNDPNGKANWFLGRSYSFTATDNSPRVTFSFDASNAKQSCQPSITNVAAKQTAPTGPPPGAAAASDPCAGGSADTQECKDVGKAKSDIDKCPPTSRDCLSSVAGDGQQTNDGIGQQTGAVKDFGNIPRDESPDAAAQNLCPLSNALTDGLPPAYMVIPPKQWGQC
ncbi:hypothetical protein ACFY00_25495 [Kitasatospora sp. NPDC001540]|uniref:hypothetical protein n=1 Tax=Kitasatospora sp. NPDC001540 TaxID=3364014 RepID=UPI0036822A19